jgi:hypothetical protein
VNGCSAAEARASPFEENSMVTVTFARIRPEKEQRLREWLADLNARQPEVRASLADEGVRQEQIYILPSSDGPILVYAMDAEDVRLAFDAFDHSKLPIDEQHRAVLAEVTSGPITAEAVYDCGR